jgi:hypothetical protein
VTGILFCRRRRATLTAGSTSGNIWTMKFRPKHEAALRIRPILEKVKWLGHKPDLIPLSDYADAETFNFLLPGNGWTFDQWHAVNTQVADQLRSLGFNVRMVKLDMVQFMDWLVRYGLKNNPQNRAQYVSWLVAPENAKPTPQAD